MILVNILTSDACIWIFNEINSVGLHSTFTFGRIQFLKSVLLFSSYLFKDDIISIVYFKSNSFGIGFGNIVCTCFNMPIFFTYYIFKVLTTALFLLDYADIMKTVINLFGSTTLPMSYFSF